MAKTIIYNSFSKKLKDPINAVIAAISGPPECAEWMLKRSLEIMHDELWRKAKQ